MVAPPIPVNEYVRLQTLGFYHLLDTMAEPVYDGLVNMSAALCNTPMALFTLLDENRQWFKAKVGIEPSETNRNISFCAYTIYHNEPFEVINAMQDVRFKDNPFVVGSPNIVYYYGLPIHTQNGIPVGSLCVMNTVSQPLTSEQKTYLSNIKLQLEALLELRLHQYQLSDTAVPDEQKFRLDKNYLLNQIINHLPDALYVKDNYARKVIANNADLKIIELSSNISPKKIIGKTDIELFGDKIGNVSYNDDMYVINSGKPIINREEKIFTNKEKNQFLWLLTTKIPLFNEQHKVIGLLGIGRDITHKKITDEILEERERQLRRLADNIPNGAIYRLKELADGNLTYEYLSNGFEKITGIRIYDVIKNPHLFLNALHPDDTAAFINKAAQAKQTDTILDVEFRLLHTSGDVRWLRCKAHPQKQADGISIIWDGIFIDNTRHKLVEVALQKSENDLQTIFENTEIGYIFMSSANLEFISFNKRAQFFTSLEHTQPLKVGSSLYDFYNPQRHHLLKSVIDKVLNGETFEQEKEIITLQQQERWFYVKFSKIVGNQYHSNGILMVLEDITDRKKSELELKKSFELLNEQNKRLVNFSYIVSHNLRSHTSNIQSISKLMQLTADEEERKELLEHLTTVAGALDETLHHLNEVISIQNHTNITLSRLSLHAYIQKTIELLKDEIQVKQALINNEVPEDLFIMHHPAYLESIVYNFLSNALKYSSPNRSPVVQITTYQERSKTVLIIADNGLGIDLNKNGAKLFGLYKTFHANQNARGIGLFITKNQIEALGGKVVAESEVNKGTTFKIYFK